MASGVEDKPQVGEKDARPREPERDPPGKPFRTPGKNRTHAAPEVATDGVKPWPEQAEPNKK